MTNKGYDFLEIEWEVVVRRRRVVPHIRHKGEKRKRKKKIRYKGRRWVVERTNSWHNRFRKLLVRYEKKSERELPWSGATGMLHHYLQEVNFGIGSKSNAFLNVT